LSGTPFQRQLPACDTRRDKSAAVPRALVHRHGLDRVELFEILQREFRGLVDLALDLDGERVGIDVERDAGEVIAHEERVIRRDGAFVEHRERRLELGRTAGQPDHRALLRILDERPLAVLKRHGHRIEGQRAEGAECRPGAERKNAGACSFDKVSSVEHGLPPDDFVCVSSLAGIEIH
jgi:hypothetical protein